jgi:hypothetical protein
MKTRPARFAGAPRAAAWLLWPASAAVFLSSFWAPLGDADLWWHLADGRAMLERGVFPDRDLFSHTLAGAAWINLEWLGEIAVYLAYKLGGFEAVFWGKAALCLAVLGGLVLALRTAKARGPGLLLLAWVGFLILRPRLFERMELATHLLMPVLAHFVLSARDTPARRGRLPWILAGLMVLWSNFHPGFIYGLGLLVLLNFGARWAGEDKSFVRALDFSVAAAAAATLANPYGWRAYAIFTEHLVQMPGAAVLIAEWTEPTVEALPYFWLAFLAAGGLLAQGILKGDRAARFWAPAVFVFAVWGSRHYRNTALFAAPAVLFLAEYLPRFRPAKAARWGWAAAAALVLLQAKLLLRPLPVDKVFRPNVPAGACRFIERHDIRGTMFNTYRFGCYIGWALGPERKVFMDGRYIFYPLLKEQRSVLEAAVLGDEAPARSFLAKHGVDHAVVDYMNVEVRHAERGESSTLSGAGLMFPPEEWALVYWDDASLVFLKRLPVWADLIERLEYRAARPYDPGAVARELERGAAADGRLERELARHHEDAGPTAGADGLRRLLQAFRAARSGPPQP